MDDTPAKPVPPTTVGAFEAKTHLSALLERVANGETITITRHGKPVAKLVPARVVANADPDRRARQQAAIDRMNELAKDNHLDGRTIRDLINEGRRY